jgi:hypothetical protein
LTWGGGGGWSEISTSDLFISVADPDSVNSDPISHQSSTVLYVNFYTSLFFVVADFLSLSPVLFILPSSALLKQLCS